MPPGKPLGTHLKALLACLVLIGFALAFSWALPFIHVSCARSGEQVNCVLQQRMLGVIPFDTTAIHDLASARALVVQGTSSAARSRTTDTAQLILTDAQGNETRVVLESGEEMSMTRSDTFAAEIDAFVASNEPKYSNWTVPLIGYGGFVPAALGFLFLGLVTWNLVDTRLRS